MSKLNLEEMAMEGNTKQNEPKEQSTTKTENNQDNENKERGVYFEAQKILKLPFVAAMQNLGLSEDEVIEAGTELLTKGRIVKKIDLPLGSYIVLSSRKASDELDYYTFVAEAISKQYTEAEFDYLMRIRNLAVSLQEIKMGDEVKDFRDKNIQERFEYLLELSAPFIAIILNASQKFWGLMLLFTHPKALDFLMKKLQK